jgi:thioredoxin:protein disulfide reductase
VREEAKRFVAVKMDGSTDNPAFQAALEKYHVVGMPTVILIDARGRELPGRITAAIDADEMLRRLAEVDRACAGPALACAARW